MELMVQKYEDYLEKSLKIIFDHYAKQSGIGKNKTFDKMEHESNSWDYASWLSFCKDYGLYDRKRYV